LANLSFKGLGGAGGVAGAAGLAGGFAALLAAGLGLGPEEPFPDFGERAASASQGPVIRFDGRLGEFKPAPPPG
jgi:hypothetical protein